MVRVARHHRFRAAARDDLVQVEAADDLYLASTLNYAAAIDAIGAAGVVDDAQHAATLDQRVE